MYNNFQQNNRPKKELTIHMKINKSLINTFLYLCLLVFFSACSTKKKTWVSRQYHNTTAKYNGYFNGNESIKYGVKKINDSFEDDYSEVLPVFRIGDLKKSKSTLPYMDKAIQKGSIVIQKHSIKIRGKEYCRWIDDNYLMVGKAYFYKGDFDEAAKTFSFIIEEYKKNPIIYEASLWLSRCFIEKKDFVSAESILIDLSNNRKFPEKLEKDFEIINADFYVRQKNYSLAKESLLNCINNYKLKKDKARLNYILAQIFQIEENFRQASKYYNQVLKSNSDYSMVFNTKMNLALCADKSSKNSEKMRKDLVKMTKDDKNIEYLDQIYYTIAKMDISAEDTLLAKENYLKSTLYSVSNDPQKALSFLALAEIEYLRSDFISSEFFFDSTIYFMPEDYRLYKQTSEKYLILKELVNNLNTINLQDSLIKLALMPRAEVNAIIKSIIDKELEKERLEKEQEMLKQQNLFESNRNSNRNEQFGNNTSGGKWYFYNPATLSFGLSEFRKKWGKRKLEDDWRRKNRKSISISTEDSSTVNRETTNFKDPQFYLQQIPSTAKDFASAREKIANSCYQAAIIYKHDLQKIQNSNEMFEKILTIVDVDSGFLPMTHYNLYLNYLEQEKEAKASSKKEHILNNYPNSVYANIILDPDYRLSVKSTNEIQDLNYEKNYESYIDGNFIDVLNITDSLKTSDLVEKYLFLKAISYLRRGDSIVAVNVLDQLKRADDKALSKYATSLLAILDDQTGLTEANRVAIEKTPYILNSKESHMFMLILPKEGVDVSFLKTLLSDYNSENHSTEIFEISAMMMGLDFHLLTVKLFSNAVEVMSYYEGVKQDSKIINEIRVNKYFLLPISLENFQEFYVNKDLKGYSKFFELKYFDKN